MYGLCKECRQPNTSKNHESEWCKPCITKHFQQNFKNWTSGNHEVDEFIQITQLIGRDPYEALEWIECDRFKNIEYLAKEGVELFINTIWKDGYIEDLDYENKQWKRITEMKVALKLFT
ncbi:hypothetical protein RclHR1_21300004 [Rhizophagus clarus]|uniref:Uncharacterized protein n=1 Tax=Rhizophagus clarus TaxID=94130 RepID=A0A2Z6R8B8_9GLOM|nr:hypothetical protein RclHR1_21300004 [Rhizophagus clarus]